MNKASLLSIILLLLLFCAACESKSEADKIIDNAIAAHGGDRFSTSEIEFDFRNIHYTIYKTADKFEYIREFSDSLGMVKDVLNNSGFVRTIDGIVIDTLSQVNIGKYSRSVNSVAYFAYLPYGLNDAASIKSSLGKTQLNGKTYDLIKVTFAKDGGGDDFDDEFLYWINQDSHFVDFMAYSYHTDGGGVRLREVSKAQEVDGMRFQNYLNFKPADEKISVEAMQQLYEAGELELLSEINLENIEVKPLSK